MTVVTTRPLIEVFSYYSSMSDPVPARPWRLGAWLFATQGHMLVARADDGSDADPTPERFLKAQRFLEETPTALADVSLSALRAFAGPIVPYPLPCAECAGSGRDDDSESVTCEHCGGETRWSCGHCGGDGEEGLATNPAIVHGVRLNRSLLAFALSCVAEEGPAQVGRLAIGTHQALCLIGQDWRIAVMCITAMSGASDPAPVFDMPTDGR